jgi:hypothetical protein
MGITSLIPGFSMKHRPLPQGPRENLLAPCLVDAGQVFGGINGGRCFIIPFAPFLLQDSCDGKRDAGKKLSFFIWRWVLGAGCWVLGAVSNGMGDAGKYVKLFFSILNL